MNEMIYGNTGKRDEGINIDMDQALYQKLQSRTFVPKLKSMLNDRLQEGDKNFVFIGEVADKSGNFSVYGYNAKLENDSRGGDYGHYIAVKADDKAVSIDVNSISFMTDEGFVEYVNLKTLNDEKRFKISPKSTDIDVNAKKRIVNNLMETFMKVRKRKNVTFSLEDCSVEEFSAKSFYVLIDLLKYIPFQMRKNISFISHVASNQKLPDMINLAAYPDSSEFKPHDCISLNSVLPFGNDGIFTGYVEKVFAMNDAEREAYFEKIYIDIEQPALNNGVDVKSDLYLLDIATKELWLNGNITEAISSIFNSASDILVIYPIYNEIARDRLTNNESEVVAYITSRINETKNTEELKGVFKNLIDVYNATRFDMKANIAELFKSHANGFIEHADSDEDIIKVVGGIVSIGVDVLDQECARNKFKTNMSKKSSINDIYSFYLKLKEKKYIDAHELNICLTESVEELILKETDKYSEAKEKLSILEKMYGEFQASCITKDYALVKEVYERYKSKYNSGANAEALSKGNDIIYEIERELKNHCSIFDVKNCIIKLANVEVNVRDGLKQKASDVYKRISRKMFDELYNEKLSYIEFKKFIQEIEPAVILLNENEVYDDRLRSGWGQEKYVPDGLYRFTTAFESLIDTVGTAESLTEALLGLENTRGQIRDEHNLSRMFEKFAPCILLNWMGKHKKLANENALKKAEKELRKNYDSHLSHTVSDIFESCLEKQNSHRRGGKPSAVRIVIAGVVVLAILGGVGFGGIKLYNHFFKKAQPIIDPNQIVDETNTVIYDDEKMAVEEYLNGFSENEMEPAQIVIGTITQSGENDKEETDAGEKYLLSITDPLETKYKDPITASYDDNIQNIKKYYSLENIEQGRDYAIVIQKDKENTFIRDIYIIPEDLQNYDFSQLYSDERITREEDQKFCSNILKFIGYKKHILTLKPREELIEEDNPDEQKEQEIEEKGSENKGEEDTKQQETQSESNVSETQTAKASGDSGDNRTGNRTTR